MYQLILCVSYSDPPSISTTESSYTVVRHESVTLICPAEGYPPPTIEWIKNGQTVPNLGLQQSTLVLNYVTQDDAGTYICRVRNIAGVTEIEITLFVLSKFEKIMFLLKISQL